MSSSVSRSRQSGVAKPAGPSIRVGVVGLGRGISFATGAATGMELVALCDTWESRLRDVGARLGVATYTDYDEFLGHDLDAVVLANYFHEHAPFAIKALEAGKHVMSETAACKTVAEGVALCRAVEQSGKTYMFAENYPYMAFNQEMRRLCRAGEIGEFQYGEGEYVHPFSAQAWNSIAPSEDHWRNWIPLILYCTHAIAPVMFITDTRPEWVNGFVVPFDASDPVLAPTARRGDPAGMIVLRMDNGAIVKALQGTIPGHGIWVRIHGSRGAMENVRHDWSAVRVRKEPWSLAEGEEAERQYVAAFPAEHADAMRAGHGGGDYFMSLEFAHAIRTGEPPFLDVYRGVAMSLCGVLAYRSALSNSAPERVPDLRDEKVRASVEDDHWTPDPAERGPDDPWPSIRGDIKPTADGLAAARKVWSESKVLYADHIESLLSAYEERRT